LEDTPRTRLTLRVSGATLHCTYTAFPTKGCSIVNLPAPDATPKIYSGGKLKKVIPLFAFEFDMGELTAAAIFIFGSLQVIM
jgi:hypothetical protein